MLEIHNYKLFLDKGIVDFDWNSLVHTTKFGSCGFASALYRSNWHILVSHYRPKPETQRRARISFLPSVFFEISKQKSHNSIALNALKLHLDPLFLTSHFAIKISYSDLRLFFFLFFFPFFSFSLQVNKINWLVIS